MLEKGVTPPAAQYLLVARAIICYEIYILLSSAPRSACQEGLNCELPNKHQNEVDHVFGNIFLARSSDE